MTLTQLMHRRLQDCHEMGQAGEYLLKEVGETRVEGKWEENREGEVKT